MFDTDKARKCFSWKGTIIGILLITIVFMIGITLFAQFGIAEFKIANNIFNCTLVSKGTFSWPHIMGICFATLGCVMIASAFVLHYKLKKSGRSLRRDIGRVRTSDQLKAMMARKASIIRLETGMTKRVVIIIISYALLYLPCKYHPRYGKITKIHVYTRSLNGALSICTLLKLVLIRKVNKTLLFLLFCQVFW